MTVGRSEGVGQSEEPHPYCPRIRLMTLGFRTSHRRLMRLS